MSKRRKIGLTINEKPRKGRRQLKNSTFQIETPRQPEKTTKEVKKTATTRSTN